MSKGKYAFVTVLLFFVINLLNLYLLGNITNALLMSEDVLSSCFGPVYSGLALLCAICIVSTMTIINAIQNNQMNRKQ